MGAAPEGTRDRGGSVVCVAARQVQNSLPYPRNVGVGLFDRPGEDLGEQRNTLVVVISAAVNVRVDLPRTIFQSSEPRSLSLWTGEIDHHAVLDEPPRGPRRVEVRREPWWRVRKPDVPEI